jgi:hypothetical protein
MKAERGLADVKSSGGAAKIELLRYRHEISQVIEPH